MSIHSYIDIMKKPVFNCLIDNYIMHIIIKHDYDIMWLTNTNHSPIVVNWWGGGVTTPLKIKQYSINLFSYVGKSYSWLYLYYIHNYLQQIQFSPIKIAQVTPMCSTIMWFMFKTALMLFLIHWTEKVFK